MNVCDTNHQISIATITKIPSISFFCKCISYKRLPDTEQTNHPVEWIHSRGTEGKVPNVSKWADSCSSSSQELLSSHSDREQSWPVLFPGLTYCHLLLSSSPSFAHCVSVTLNVKQQLLPSSPFMELSESRNRFPELQVFPLFIL